MRVGKAMIERYRLDYPHWGKGSNADRDRRLAERAFERHVSDYVRDLPLLWTEIDDEPGPGSDRALLKRNAIPLVSNYRKETINPRRDD